VWCGLPKPRPILDQILQCVTSAEFKAGTACSLYQPLQLHTAIAAFRSCDPCHCIRKDVATSELHSPSSSILAAGIWQISPCSVVWLAGMEPKHLRRRTQLIPGLSHKNKSMKIHTMIQVCPYWPFRIFISSHLHPTLPSGGHFVRCSHI
jgi:hypothetical protein